jgi:hypothetical protein
MKNGIFKLDYASIGDAFLTAGVFAILAAAAGIVTAPGFDLFAIDWLTVGKSMLNVGFVAGFISVTKDLLSTNNGGLLGIGSPYTPTK